MSSKSAAQRLSPTKRADNRQRPQPIQRQAMGGGSPNPAEIQKRLGNQGTQAWLAGQHIQTVSHRPEEEKTTQLQLGEEEQTFSTRTAIIQRREESSTSEETSEGLETRLNRIETTYRQMISKAREDGYDVAADNLERFLAGTGGIKILSVTWLRGFSAITEAERVNQERFEETLTDIAYDLRDGETRTFTDHWDRKLTASLTTELYYASGTSTIRSTGTFTLSRSGNIITIEGTTRHHWHDPYDWHAGLAAYIPGFGTISDTDALLLQEHRGAAPFNMEADWAQTLNGTVESVEWWFDKVNYRWSGP